MITWAISEVNAALDKVDEEAKKIQRNALEEFKKLKDLKSDEEAKKAEEVKRQFGKVQRFPVWNPVLVVVVGREVSTHTNRAEPLMRTYTVTNRVVTL